MVKVTMKWPGDKTHAPEGCCNYCGFLLDESNQLYMYAGRVVCSSCYWLLLKDYGEKTDNGGASPGFGKFESDLEMIALIAKWEAYFGE
jgi:hypothetical protein